MQDAEWTGVEDAEAPQQAAQPMALGNTSPHFLPKRAEAFLPWSLPGAALISLQAAVVVQQQQQQQQQRWQPIVPESQYAGSRS